MLIVYRVRETLVCIEPRTWRAPERAHTVTHTDGTPISGGENPTVVSVHSGNSGKECRVDVAEGRCTCPDHQHREVKCAHVRRARTALGVESVNRDTLAAVDVHARFAEHAPGPVVATSDGGHVGGDEDKPTLLEKSPTTRPKSPTERQVSRVSISSKTPREMNQNDTSTCHRPPGLQCGSSDAIVV